MVVALVVTATVLVGGCVPEPPRRLEEGPCASTYSALVEGWVARGPAFGDGAQDGTVPVRTPVGEIGDWVVRTPRGDVVLVDDGRAVPVCGAAEGRAGVSVEVTDEGGIVAPFTDADLRAALETHADGVVVYVWSPHMPLSVDGYREVLGAATRRGFTVIPVLFAASDGAFARREARRVGMPESALRTVTSAELLLRDAQVHAPSVVVFRGRTVSPVMPGYRDADGYGRWLDAAFSSAERPPGRQP